MFRSAAPLVLTLATVLACSGEPTTAPSLTRTQVPSSSTYLATGTLEFDGACSGAGVAHVRLSGGGVESHVGRYTIVNEHCVNTDTGAFFEGRFTKTVASGDELRGTYAGTSQVTQAPNPVGIFAVDGVLRFTGGTGRFAGATGSERMLGTQTIDFSQPPFAVSIELRMDGTISTVGSDR